MNRVLVIPAAGRGSRLGSDGPKFLHPVGGRPMLDYLLDLYLVHVDRVALVVHPSAEAAVRRHCARRGVDAVIAHQEQATGMLDAILCPHEELSQDRPDRVLISWCDQVAVRPETVRRMIERAEGTPTPWLTLATGWNDEPYIHLERDAEGRIVNVLERREGKPMPERGEGDSGIFTLSAEAYFDRLPQFAREARTSEGTGERNFLPFIPWAAARGIVETISVEHPIEQIGVNTPEQAEQLEAFLDGR